MRYISTRGQAPALSFKDVLLAGLARDGGLYVPESYPQLTNSLKGLSYQAVAFEVLNLLTGAAFPEKQLKTMINEAYAGFRNPAVTPLIQTNTNEWVLELFHGPTLAFKDLAMQLLGRMMAQPLAIRAGQRLRLSKA
jgi:threonine synthase